MCAEAQYAFNIGKPIIPLRLEADYSPDGWLGPLCLNSLYYDFTSEERFDNSFTKLLAELQAIRPRAVDTGYQIIIPITIGRRALLEAKHCPRLALVASAGSNKVAPFRE